MIALETFTFETHAGRFGVEAVNAVQAFGAANLRCEQQGIALPQGVWMETLEPRAYLWTAGNFFD